MIPEEDEVIPSEITFNGYDSKRILYSSDKDHGVVYHPNKFDNSTWTFNLHDALWNDYTIFKTYENAKSKKL